MRLSVKRNLTRAVAAGLTAVISPLAAFSISGNLEHISGAFNAAVEYIRESTSEEALSIAPSPVNNGALMLYHPETQELVEILPPAYSETPPTPEPPAEETEPTTIPVMSRNISPEREDLSLFSSRDGVVTRMTFRPELSMAYLQLDGGGRVRNTTAIPDSWLLHESRQPLSRLPVIGDEPQVLIIHTHTNEAFTPGNGVYFDESYTFRSPDSSKNIVAVGAKIAEEIAKSGFTVIHDGTMHDYPVFSGSYNRSAETVEAILAEFPSIKVVLDIHRDGIESEGAPVAAVSNVHGREAAQIMIISPADDGNWGVPDFMENFRFAGLLQSQLESDNPGLTRAVLLQYCNYNLHLSPGALLIEVGSHGNTLEQALYAGELFGQSVGRLLSRLADNSDEN
jgi:stage II sporulation protein P